MVVLLDPDDVSLRLLDAELKGGREQREGEGEGGAGNGRGDSTLRRRGL